MKLFFWLTLFLVLPCGVCSAMQESGGKYKILILGDSISMGYTPFVKKQLADFADVSRPTVNDRDENCDGTTKGVQHLDRWLEDAGAVDLIFFNFGLHDLKRVNPESRAASNSPADLRQAEPEIYREQLSQIVQRLKQTGARLVFVTTTPVPKGGVKPWRDVGDPLHYNAIARTVIDSQGIGVLDLYSPALKNLAIWQKPVNVHFNASGSDELAKLVSARARDILGRKEPATAPGEPWTANAEQVQRLSAKGDFLYREADVPAFDLPEVFGFSDNPMTSEIWPVQREFVLDAFTTRMYGRPPDEMEKATTRFEAGLPAVSKVDPRISTSTVRAIVEHDGKELIQFPFHVFRPVGEGPHPAIILIHNREFPDVNEVIEKPTGFLPVSMLVENGFAVAVFHTSDVEPDRADANGAGIRATCDRVFGDVPDRPDHWGCLTAWAWGASRVADYLTADTKIDADRIAVIGHSRGGKTALWAAAQDGRFAVAISNESGCGGAALSRRKYGETVDRITTAFPYWFAPQFSSFSGREQDLPIDQHQLIGLIAPRGVCIGSASEDLWADPRGEYLSLANAAPVYQLMGEQSISKQEMPALGEQVVVGPTSYHVRPEGHDLTEGDWMRYILFLRQHYGSRQTAFPNPKPSGLLAAHAGLGFHACQSLPGFDLDVVGRLGHVED